MKTQESQGLVICPKTSRSDVETVLTVLAQQMETSKKSPTDGSGHFIVLTPASIRLKRRGLKTGSQKGTVSDRQSIKGWSRKSRANMVSRFSSLDLSPMEVGGGDSLAVMITLTYPNDWLALVPTAAHAKRHLQKFKKRYERKFGRPFFAMWKEEFQRRGAVHFHIFTASPVTLVDFRKWVATTWSEVVGSVSEEERLKHLSAGTAVDIAEGTTIANARLIAVYFSKHSSANFGKKEYQNNPPQEWLETGSVGRFWGYWNLKPLEIEATLTQDEVIAVARVLRRWFRSRRYTRVERVFRTNQRGTVRYRTMRRRTGRMSQSYGFISLEDSVSMAKDLNRFLQMRRGSASPGSGS